MWFRETTRAPSTVVAAAVPGQGESQVEWELALRLEAMRWLDGRDGELVRYAELTAFTFAGGGYGC